MRRLAAFSSLLMVSFSINAWHGLIEIQGHRGCRGHYPENTLAAFQAALDASIDVLEMDVAVTADKALVISHDPYINPEICRYSDGRAVEQPLLINALTLAEVKSFDCGSIQHKRFPDQITVPNSQIPTLQEVFELVRSSPAPHATKIGFNIETKIFPDQPELTVGPEEFTDLVVAAIKESGFLTRTTLQSFDPRILHLAKSREFSLRRVLLVEDEKVDLITQGYAVGAFAISPDVRLLSKELVRSLQDRGWNVIPWTANSKEEWLRLIDFGVDGIITDYPQELQAFVYDNYFKEFVGEWRKVDSFYHEIAEPHAHALANAIISSNTVKHLYLQANRLRSRGALLAPMFEKNVSLEAVHLNVNELDDEAAAAIAFSMRDNRAVRDLCLYHNAITDKGMFALAEMLKVNTTLESLSLDQNLIGDDGIVALAEALRVNKTLKKLDLRENKFGEKGIDALADALSVNGSITTLLYDSDFFRQKRRIAKELGTNAFLSQCKDMHKNEWCDLEKLMEQDALTLQDHEGIVDIMRTLLKFKIR